MSSCGAPSIDTIGGIQVQLKFESDVNPESQAEDIQTIIERVSSISSNSTYFSHTIDDNKATINLPGVKDITSVRRLLEWNRSIRLSYAIETSSFPDVRTYLDKYIEVPIKNKPYKSSSMIGLVSSKEKDTVETILKSESFKSKFPMVGKYYWGVERMLGKYALFLESKTSSFIDESMFEKIEARQSKDKIEGILTVKLAKEYEDEIGQITGNDSTYLLHSFHNEVYISKIIKPHITDSSFLISGAFTPKDALVLGSLWNSNSIQNKFKIEDIILLGAED